MGESDKFEAKAKETLGKAKNAVADVKDVLNGK